ncbi:MAG: ABC transporter six-transmembrane domain-containing protein [Pseudomonadota bacterium]
MPLHDRKLSIASLMRVFWKQVAVTNGLTLAETAMLASLPLLLGWSIDGLLNNDWTAFIWLAGTMGLLLLLAIDRRVYDTRAYGTVGVELGMAVVHNTRKQPVSTINARLDMSHELVTFLENEVPVVLTATVQLVASLAVLFVFHRLLAAMAGGAILLVLAIYALSGSRFFALNSNLNEQAERQVSVLENGSGTAIRHHLSLLRGHVVRLSDTEAIVYGAIFAVLLAMLGVNLWFAATQITASAGQIFAIVVYSYEMIESAVILPAALQSLTRIAEITRRINGDSA